MLGGAVLRVDPETGAALPTNPNFGHSNANARRIIAYGFRNPFRIAARPGTNEIWVGDVGWSSWEEINRIQNPTAGVLNFGWPCYEGSGPQGQYDAANLSLCETLYAQGGSAVATPMYTYKHTASVVPVTGARPEVPRSRGSPSTTAGNYPASYSGALFFADYSRCCIWAMLNPPGTPPPALPPGLVAALRLQRGHRHHHDRRQRKRADRLDFWRHVDDPGAVWQRALVRWRQRHGDGGTLEPAGPARRE